MLFRKEWKFVTLNVSHITCENLHTYSNNLGLGSDPQGSPTQRTLDF